EAVRVSLRCYALAYRWEYRVPLSTGGYFLICRGCSAQSDFKRERIGVVTLSETKGLSERFFASLRMTGLDSCVVKCTSVRHSGLTRREGFDGAQVWK